MNCPKVVSTLCGSRRTYAISPLLPRTRKPASSGMGTKYSFHCQRRKENAVVLCNEALLLPVLHSIPQEVENVNITMGFPLAQTPVYSFINAAMELQTNGYRTATGRFTYETVSAILKHPYTRQLSINAEPLERELTKTNRFYPLPSELKMDDFLIKLFTPRSGIKELCDYLTN